MFCFVKRFNIRMHMIIVVLVILCAVFWGIELHAAAAEGDCYTITVVNENGSSADGEGYAISETYTLYEDASGQLGNEYGQLILGPKWENRNNVIGWRITDNTDLYNNVEYLREQVLPLTADVFGNVPGDYTLYAVWNHTLTAEYYSGVSDAYTLIDETWNTGEAVERVYCGEYASDSSESDTISYILPWAYRDKFCLVGWKEIDTSGAQQVILPVGTSYIIDAGDAGDAGSWGELNAVKQYYAVWEDAPWEQIIFEADGNSLSEEPGFFGGTTNYWAFSESYESDTQKVYTVYAPSSEDTSVYLTLPQVTCAGYTFEGWDVDGSVYSGGTVFEVPLNGTEYVFTAIWSKQTSSATGSSSSVSSSYEGEAISSVKVRYFVDGVEVENLMSSASVDVESDKIVIKLPAAQSKTGYYWGGWVCNIDGAVYPANSTVQLEHSKTDVTFTAMLTPQIQPGAQILEADTQYYLPNGLWTMDDDKTIYSGKRYFYVEESGEYTFIRN